MVIYCISFAVAVVVGGVLAVFAEKENDNAER